jgi:Fe-S cluster biogenesis protein NfuA
MASLGIRRFIKNNIKRALGIGPGADTEPPNWQSRPPAPQPEAQAAPKPAPPQAAPQAEPVKAEPVKAEPVKAESAPESAPEPAPVAAAEEAAKPVVHQPAELGDDEVGLPLTTEAVQEILDDMVRPALQGDGGDIALIKVEDNNVYVKLVGACSTCPSSIMTMKMGVEALLKEEFPSMNELVDVGGSPPA